MKSLMEFMIKSYNKIPVRLLNIIAPIYNLLPDSIRFTSIYKNEWKELERIESLSNDEIENEQNLKLQKLIKYSYEHVPYYHKLFDQHGIDPTSIKTKSDLPIIPLLSKEDLINNLDDLISDEFAKDDLIYITTSGSTGTPVGFYVQQDSHIRDWVYGYYYFREFGYTTRCGKLMLRGKMFNSQKNGKNYQWDAFKKELSINIFSMNEENMEEYCKAIEKYKPGFVHGYMSAMYTLCKYIEKRPKGLKHVFRGFLAISEAVQEEQKQFVEKIINAPVISSYGMSERVIWGTIDYPTGEYKLAPLYGVTELVASDGNIISEKGEKGELVGTGLLNYGMPLIRYRTGDISSWAERDGYITKVDGRWKHDLLIGKDGSKITMTALNMHSEIFNHVYRYQLVQYKKGEIEIKIVPDNEFSEDDIRRLIDEFSLKTGNNMSYVVSIVKDIKPKANGKISLVEQHLNLDE